MRNGWYKKGRVLSLAIAGILGAGMFGVAHAQLAGIDFNGDGNCATGTGSAGQVWGAGDVGTVNTFDIFLEGLDPLFSVGCTFCVGERSKVTNESWTYSTPDGWSEQPMSNSVDSPGGVFVTASYTATHPNYKCWLVQATDFGASTPMTIPGVVGTFTWEVAAEGAIYWVIDKPYTGYLTTSFASGDFSQPGHTVCPDVTSTERNDSWGDIKQLFR